MDVLASVGVAMEPVGTSSCAGPCVFRAAGSGTVNRWPSVPGSSARWVSLAGVTFLDGARYGA